jgi:hypothetical protein
LPTAAGRGVQLSIVKAVIVTGPELDPFWYEAKSRPERWSRYDPPLVFLFQPLELADQFVSGRQRCALA